MEWTDLLAQAKFWGISENGIIWREKTRVLLRNYLLRWSIICTFVVFLFSTEKKILEDFLEPDMNILWREDEQEKPTL
jgi:hypothetical protein